MMNDEYFYHHTLFNFITLKQYRRSFEGVNEGSKSAFIIHHSSFIIQ